MKRVYLDLHAVQTVPPNCLNRDDTGSPKTAQYGGVTRARVSSQSWKKAMRDSFSDFVPQEDLGMRSKRILDLVIEEVKRLDDTLDARSIAENLLRNGGLKFDKNGETGALFFISYAQVKALAQLAVEREDLTKATLKAAEKNEIQAAIKAKPSIDLAFFGRMVADDASLNVDAAAQVAHAISTHAIANEYDYFTAVDDLGAENHAGAAHIGTIEYNSSTLYRYANIAVHDLFDNLREDAFLGIEAFINAFVKSMPTGKQNTFANRTLPNALVLCVRSDQPLNFVGAFEKPVVSAGEGYVRESIRCLTSYALDAYQNFANEPISTHVVGDGLNTLGERNNLPTAISSCLDELKKAIRALP